MKFKHYENHKYEEDLYKLGYNLICGTDEVGRGPIAGPVVACAIIMPKDCHIEGVTDSKKISLKKRYKLKELILEKAIAYKITFISEKVIDEINIYEASRKAMIDSILNLSIKPDYVLSDAMPLNLDVPSTAIIKGDELSFTIGCASILAKIARDEYMDEIDKKFPEYGFAKHKGYPTKQHLEALKKYGVLEINRKTYGPVKKEIEKNNFYKL